MNFLKRSVISLVAAITLLVGGHTVAQAQNFSSVAVLNGSCSAPSFTFFNNPTSGFYLLASGTVAICINGNEVGRITASGVQTTGSGGAVQISQSTGQVAVSSASQTATTNFQAGSFDANLSGTPGHTSGYLAGSMGNVRGSITGTGNSNVAGDIGKYDITGTNSSTNAKAGVIGEIGDNSTSADGAFVAVLGGDTSTSSARAAYTVDRQNSTVASTFTYGLDLAGPGSHDTYQAMTYGTADIRLQNNATIVGVSTAITANVTTCPYTAGTFVITNNVTGRLTLWICDGAKYQKPV